MKAVLNRLFQHEKLEREEARRLLIDIAQEKFHPYQVASFMTVFQMRPIQISELQGFRDALLELCVPVDLNGMETLDIVGTGGDGKNTFNISTTSAFVIAGAGYKVTKHGSYGVSSAVGSSNLLMALGYQFTNDVEELKQQLDAANLCFLHAPLFHPALKAVVPIRKEMKVRTFFNVLGPLVNPIQPAFQLFGTSTMELARLYQYIMQESGRRFVIVHALDGYDEISLTGTVNVRSNEGERNYTPESLHQNRYQQADLHGGDTPEEAAQIFHNILHNQATDAQKSVVIANSGVAIQCIKPSQPLEDCMAEARESIESGRALNVFKVLTS